MFEEVEKFKYAALVLGIVITNGNQRCDELIHSTQADHRV